MEISLSRTKEMVCSFSKSILSNLPNALLNIEQIMSAKLLGYIFQFDLKPKAHLEMIWKEIARKMYLLRQLRKYGMQTSGLQLLFDFWITSHLTYCSTVYGNTSSTEVSKIDRVLKNAHRSNYSTEELTVRNMISRRDEVLFQKIEKNGSHLLKGLLPAPRESNNNTRPTRGRIPYRLPKICTESFKNCF